MRYNIALWHAVCIKLKLYSSSIDLVYILHTCVYFDMLLLHMILANKLNVSKKKDGKKVVICEIISRALS